MTASERIRAEVMARPRPWLYVLSDRQYKRYVAKEEWLYALSDSKLRWFLLFVACALEG